ncbi:MAG: adenylate/guanylate cyclase domain-containing protein [Bryobacteraceae bacterium]
MDSAYLVVYDVDGERNQPLGDGRLWKIGRHESCEVRFQSSVVSRQHAMLQLEDNGDYILIDLGSRNGSFVNGQRVAVPVTLHNDDEISIGDCRLLFHAPETKQAAVAAEDQKAMDMSATKALFSVKETSVLVVDVRGFTVLTQRVGHDLLCQVIGTFFRKGGVILQSRHSWAQKYIGDAIMAVWVHKNPEGKKKDIIGILHSLVELADMAATLQPEFGLPEPIRIGAGINSGMAAIGNTGGGQNNDYTALGDTVNATFRYETATKEAGTDVLIGPETHAVLKAMGPDLFTPYTVNLKGYDKPANLFGISFADLRKFAEGLPESTN